MRAPVRVLRTFRYAVYFDGINDYAVITDSPSLRITDHITVEALINPVIATAWRAIITGKAYTYLLALYDWKIRWYLGTGSTWFLTAITVPISSYRFSHVVSNYSKDTGVYQVFVDGSLAHWGSTTPQPIAVNNFGVSVGAAYPPTPALYWFSGYISAVRIYSRVLGAEEVAHNYSNPGNPARSGLVLWLQAHPDNVKDLDGDGVLEWLDLSGYNNHAKLYGATLVEVVKSPARVLSPARVVPTV